MKTMTILAAFAFFLISLNLIVSVTFEGASVSLVPTIVRLPADSDGASVSLVPNIVRLPADSIDVQTGLINDPNLLLVKAHCTGCHSPKLITQTRLKRDQWQERIRWMQRNHKLWDLGEAEKPVLDYLEKYYSPSKTVYSRREPLQNIKWYKANQ
ncbi:MAG: hypothetical protein ACK4GN_18825 [Runella sp.]